MSKFENITDIAKMICGFIFSHSGEEPAGVSELIFGVSATYVSVRHLGPGLHTEMLEQDLPALFVHAIAELHHHGGVRFPCVARSRA